MPIVYKYGCKPPVEIAKAHEILRTAHRYRNTLVEIQQAAAACKYLAGVTQDEALRDSIAPLKAAETRAARASSGLHYGTYWLVEHDVRKATRFARFTGAGRIGAPVPTSGRRATTQSVLAGCDPNLQLRRLDVKHYTARLRVGRGEWLTCKVTLHRPLPDATVLQAWLQCEPVAAHNKWALCLVLSTTRTVARKPTGRAGGLDIGWRRLGPDNEDFAGGWRVAADSDGDVYELPRRLIERYFHARSVEAIRARAFNAHKPHAAMKSPNKLARRVRAGEYPELEVWRKQDRHLYNWHEYQEQGVIRARDHHYRQLAVQLCKKFDTIYIEDFDLRGAAERKIAGHQRFDVAPGRFREALKLIARNRGVALVEVDPAYSNACTACGYWDKTQSGIWVSCKNPQCAEFERSCDGDVKAAKNLRIRGLENGALAKRATAL